MTVAASASRAYGSAAPILCIHIIALVMLLGGCASGRHASEPLGGRRNVLTAEEISRITVGSAYEAIEQLRPEFLRSRGAISFRTESAPRAAVYLDAVYFGPIASLRNIRATQIMMIEYLNASDATTRFGTNHAGGAIVVTSR